MNEISAGNLESVRRVASPKKKALRKATGRGKFKKKRVANGKA
jgi:hypothetical protein